MYVGRSYYVQRESQAGFLQIRCSSFILWLTMPLVAWNYSNCFVQFISLNEFIELPHLQAHTYILAQTWRVKTGIRETWIIIGSHCILFVNIQCLSRSRNGLQHWFSAEIVKFCFIFCCAQRGYSFEELWASSHGFWGYFSNCQRLEYITVMAG
jgi:hypothetical protein